MFRKTLLATTLALLAAPSALAGPDRTFDLMVGDKAPELALGGWIKGDAIPAFQQGTVYVVEFWATWCGPCRKAIPHMSELQATYATKNVRFLGVSIWENAPEDAAAGAGQSLVNEQVKAFVDRMGDKMAYTVAYDLVPAGDKYNASQGKMARGWMHAAGQDGIPTAFVVDRSGTVAWIGSPFGIDEPLKAIVAGEWDLAAATTKYQQEMEAQAVAFKLRDKIEKAMSSGDTQAAIAAFDEAFAANPSLEGQFGPQKMMVLINTGHGADAMAYGAKLADGVFKDNKAGLNFVAWSIVDPQSKLKETERDLALALRASERANELAEWKDAALLDTYASALFLSGKVDKAIEHQEKAVKLSTGMPYEQDLKNRLEEYRAKAGTRG